MEKLKDSGRQNQEGPKDVMNAEPPQTEDEELLGSEAPWRIKAQQLEDGVTELSEKMELEREARRQAELRATSAEIELESLQVKVSARVGSASNGAVGEEDGSLTHVPMQEVKSVEASGADAVLRGPEESFVSERELNAELRKMLANNVVQMRSMQQDAIISQHEVRAHLETIAALEEEVLRVKAHHAALGIESEQMVEATLAAERTQHEEQLESLHRRHIMKERALLDTGELATEALAKALSRAEALDEQNAIVHEWSLQLD